MECYTFCKVQDSSVNVVIEFFQLQHFANGSHRNIRHDKRLTYKIETNVESTIILTCSYTMTIILYYYNTANVINQ